MARSQRLGISRAGSTWSRSTNRNPTRSPIAPRTGRRSWTNGTRARTSSSDGVRSIRPATCSASRNGRRRSTSSSGDRQPDPLAVEPFQTLPVEHRTALVDRLELEPGAQLVEPQDLLLGPGRPAQQGQVVDQTLADEALRDVVPDRGLALALAHLGPIRVEDQGQVSEARNLLAQSPEEQDVLGRIAQVILAPDDVSDPHRRVVDHDGEVIERRAVAPDDHEVAAQVGHIDLDPAADDVIEPDDPLTDPEAEGGRPVLGGERGAFRLGQLRAAAVVARRQLGRLESLALGVQLVRSAETGVGLVGRPETIGGLGVEGQPLHLAIRPVRPAGLLAGDARSFVPGQTEPVEPVQDVLLVGQRRAGDVGVLETQQERPADVAGEQEVEQGGPGGADVERSGRARGDPDPRADRCQRRR